MVGYSNIVQSHMLRRFVEIMYKFSLVETFCPGFTEVSWIA